MKSTIILFLKGILMGICDIIPGISGGTIAFITGIYPKLINSVKSITPKILLDLFNKEKMKTHIKNIDPVFLLILLSGIGLAFLAGSRVIKFLLENHFAYTMAFFIGLICSSSKIIYDNIENHKVKNIAFGLVGFACGVLLAFLMPAKITPNLLYVFLGGFVAISAMFLPGISGSFILVILGLYEFMLEVLHNVSKNLPAFLSFVFGASLGAFGISRLISFLFKKDKCKTLYMLLGLVLGALSIPISKIYMDITKNGGVNGIILVGLFVLGAFAVIIVNKEL